MSVGVPTNIIIDTKKVKRKSVKANCKRCVNNTSKGCRFSWETINGKCTRYGVNKNISKEDSSRIKQHNKQIINDKKNIKLTTVENISKSLGINLTFEQICSYRKPTLLGNMKFAIRRVGSLEDPIIEIIYANRKLRYRIIK